MPDVIADITMSLDGYGARRRPEHGLGVVRR
jgi:hypothetical protein